MTLRPALLCTLIVSAFAATSAHAAIDLIAVGSLTQANDLSGLSGTLENGAAASMLGGIGSGLAWAGGSTFLALPDRGPNAVTWNSALNDTTSYIARFQTVNLALTKTGTTFTVTPTLTGTTLLYSNTALTYGAAGSGAFGPGSPATAVSWAAGAPSINTSNKFYFTGRSDGFDPSQSSLNGSNARLDTEGLRVSNDGRSVYISDEYGPYVYQFDRATGARIRTFTLPANLGITNLSAVGATEISNNTASGRIANKGMEGLAITPDGSTLYGFMQSPLAQDGGDGKRYNRIVKINIASGAVNEYAYDSKVLDPASSTGASKTYNSSELLAVNDHQFLVLERDGKGLGDGSPAVMKQLRLVDLAGAADVSGVASLPSSADSSLARSGTLFLDIAANLKSHGYAATDIPAKIEGAAFGADFVDGGVTHHTLYIANDNDFVPASAGANKFFVFSFTDADLAAKGVTSFSNQTISAVPEPQSWALMVGGIALLGVLKRRRAAPPAA